MSAPVANITPKVVKWARERAGLTTADVAVTLKTSLQNISDWEGERGKPSVPHAIRLADILHVPFAYLFLSEPPEEKLPIPDLRTLGSHARTKLSVDFIDVLMGCMLRQDWYRDYVKDNGAKPLKFPGSMSIDDGVAAVAEEISMALRIDEGLREESNTWEEFRSKLVQAAERIGILVMQSGIGTNTLRPLDVKEFRGFAIVDDYAPLVFINAKDAATARIFTLIHEIVHIWIGQSGISNPDPKSRSTDERSQIEAFCNKVAAEVLVPKNGITKRWDEEQRIAENVQRIARYYRVSRYVVLRQAYEQSLITKPAYTKFLDENPSMWKPADAGGGGSFYPTFYSRNSRRVVRGAVRALGENKMTYKDACDLFGVKVKTMKKVLERFGE